MKQIRPIELSDEAQRALALFPQPIREHLMRELITAIQKSAPDLPKVPTPKKRWLWFMGNDGKNHPRL